AGGPESAKDPPGHRALDHGRSKRVAGMRSYKIALVSDWYYPRMGGIEYAIDALGRGLVALGHEVHIIARRFGRASAREASNGLPIIRLEGFPLSERLLSPRGYRSLRETLRAGDFDIIHGHGLDSPMAMVSLIIAAKLGIPSIITSHSLLGDSLLQRALAAGATIFLRPAQAIIAVSSPVERQARAMFRGAVFRIPNGIDTSSPNGALDPIALPQGNGPVIATVARMNKRKGVQDLITVAAMLVAKHPSLLFLMVGDGPLRLRLERGIQASGLGRHFLFTGGVSRATVLHLLGQSDVFVSPSPREAFGICVLEAFLKKVPVVARGNTGVADIISHEQTGFLADDVAGVAHYIDTLIQDPELRSAVARRAHEELDKYQWNTVARQVEQVYAHATRETGGYFG
ncbi:MAG: glycosyltransferase family 4 protein, partial [Gammaproteobacteria bacterium]